MTPISQQHHDHVENCLEPPFFIVGCRRSGTTLLSQLLNAHSRLAVYFETYYYPILHADVYRYGTLEKPHNLNRLISDVLQIVQYQHSVAPTVQEVRDVIPSHSFEGVLHAVLHLFAVNQGKRRAGEKTPDHCFFLREILSGFPDSPVIFVVRDPRDTVYSIRRYWNTSVAGACHSWNQALNHFREASRPVHLVQYEHLVLKPVETLRTICSELNEPFEPTMSEFHQSVPENIYSKRHLSMLTSPINGKAIGGFRQMAKHEIEEIESLCATGMRDMEYEPTKPPRLNAKVLDSKQPSPFRRLLDRLRYYGLKRKRWRKGLLRWKILLRIRCLYVLTLGPLWRNR